MSTKNKFKHTSITINFDEPSIAMLDSMVRDLGFKTQIEVISLSLKLLAVSLNQQKLQKQNADTTLAVPEAKKIIV